MPRAIKWDVPIVASWARASLLASVTYDDSGVRVLLYEEESEQRYSLHFKNVQGLCVTTEECPSRVAHLMPNDGGFFEIMNSEWIGNLGGEDVPFLNKSHHYVVRCYDEIIEVVAWECEIGKA